MRVRGRACRRMKTPAVSVDPGEVPERRKGVSVAGFTDRIGHKFNRRSETRKIGSRNRNRCDASPDDACIGHTAALAQR